MVAKSSSSDAGQFWRAAACWMFFAYIWLMCTSARAVEPSNLLVDGGFENYYNGIKDNWTCLVSTCRVDSTGNDGHYLRTHSRTDKLHFPRLTFHKARPGKTYDVTSWVKMLNDEGGTIFGQEMSMIMRFYLDDKSTATNFARHKLFTTADGWVMMRGLARAPKEPFYKAELQFRGPVSTVNFAIDNVSIKEYEVNDDDWKVKTDASISKHRKSDIHLDITRAAHIDPSKVEILVTQTSKSFPFGTAVRSGMYSRRPIQKYKDIIHRFFNWAVLENALKWKIIEPVQGKYRFVTYVNKSLNGLRENGLKLRGHNMLWSKKGSTPDWVTKLSGVNLTNAVKERMRWTLEFTKGKLEHWDVNNENKHNNWYQRRLNDRDYDLEMFRIMHALDPYPKLFLNENGAVNVGHSTAWYRNEGLRYKNAKVHMYGMGVESHFKYQPIPAVIKYRLDILAEVGVPIWATELDVVNANEAIRADWYEQAFSALYAHPAVEGIVMWGFWGDITSGGQNAALVTGPDLRWTQAGTRVFDLLENKWMTREKLVLSKLNGGKVTVRGFHGDYRISVKYNNIELPHLVKTFTLKKSADHTVRISVQ